MAASVSTALYNRVKFWGEHDSAHSAYSGEVGRLGFRVPEPYLDDRDSQADVRLKRWRGAAHSPL